MNERIKELAEQAIIYIEPNSDHDGTWAFDKEKFAELIVRECQSRVEQYIKDCGEIGCLPDTVIKKHFGVE
jgi:hypothetical protein